MTWRFRPLGPRTGVYAEPSVVAKAASEFADTEAMIEAVETRFGPYRWGRYDLLVLPPSFPFGGMENPKLTFATPDDPRRRSLAGLARGPRAGPFVVGQPGDERHLARFLAQRGFHRLPRAADRRRRLRPRPRGDGSGPRPPRAPRGTGRVSSAGTRSSTSTSPAAIPTKG